MCDLGAGPAVILVGSFCVGSSRGLSGVHASVCSGCKVPMHSM